MTNEVKIIPQLRGGGGGENIIRKLYLSAESQSVSSSDPSSVNSFCILITSGLLSSDTLSDCSVIEVALSEPSGFNGLRSGLACDLAQQKDNDKIMLQMT